MKLNFRTIGKIGFLFVMIGFFMPVACDMNGFQVANTLMENEAVFDGLLLYLLILSAFAGITIGVLLLIKKTIKVSIDWVVIVICIASGLIVYFSQLKDAELQQGAYVIITGWIITIVGQICSIVKKENV